MSTWSITPVQSNILHNAAIKQKGLIEFEKLTQKGHARNLVIQSMMKKKLITKTDTNGQYQMTEHGYMGVGLEFPKPKVAKKTSKQAIIIEMLKRPEGATNAQMMAATNWLPHSIRGLLSGTVRKKLGLNVTSTKNTTGERVYRIA